MPEATKWIAFGCSYAGMLAAWLRLKYPDQVHGAISSSAPLEAKLGNSDHHEMVHKAMNEVEIKQNEVDTEQGTESTCIGEAEKGVKSFEKLDTKVQEKLLNQHFTKETLKRNSNFTFRTATFHVFATATQYNRNDSNPMFNIELACHIILDTKLGEPMERVFEMLKNVDQHKSTYTAFEHVGEKQWNFQICNEFGGLGSEKLCQVRFGPKFTKEYITQQIEKTNSNFGGKEPNVTNVVFINGSMDPWSPRGRTEPMTNEGVEVIVIEGASHCQDSSMNHGDWPEMQNAKTKIKNSLAKWISM